jgi:hypothetical protein
MLLRLRGWVYGSFAPAGGIVVRLLEFCAADAGGCTPGGRAVAGVVVSKVNTWAPFCSGGCAERGGVAVMAALGKQICLITAGEMGCAVTGVSR